MLFKDFGILVINLNIKNNWEYMETGTYIICDFFECSKNTSLLVDTYGLKREMIEIIQKSELSVLDEKFFKFDNGGITAVVLLAESHFAIHTWPEKDNFLTIDIFVCNHKRENSDKAEKVFNLIKELFDPKKVVRRIL